MAVDPEALEALKAQACADVDRRAAMLLDASHHIHAHPELCYEEHDAHDVLTTILDEAGLEPERGAFDLPTAFRARAGEQGPVVAVMCEYDALPGIGHACGHNIIATAGLGAALAAASVASAAGGRLVVLGTPAEEGGGGKVEMARRGAYDGLDAAVMVHPADADLAWMDTLAIAQLEVSYEGRAAHAAAFPWEGRNALDAAVLGYMGVAALRQHIRPTERVHGVFTKAGDKANIVPKEAAASWYVRSPDGPGLAALKERVLTCLHAGAVAAGCTMQHEWDSRPYAELRHNEPLGDAYAANIARLGREVADPRLVRGVVGSTDMGNVSQLVPAIHPMIAVAPPGVPIHTPEFAEHAASPAGDRAVLDGAKALAMTIIDLWAGAGVLEAARSAFAASGPARPPLGL
jgi:amidohydrolase